MSKLIIFSLMVILYSCASATPEAKKARELLQKEYGLDYTSKGYFDAVIRNGNIGAYFLFETSYDGNIPFWEDKGIDKAIYYSVKNDKKDLFSALMKSKAATVEMKSSALGMILELFNESNVLGSELNCMNEYVKELVDSGAETKSLGLVVRVAKNFCSKPLDVLLTKNPSYSEKVIREISGRLIAEIAKKKSQSVFFTAYMQEIVPETLAVIKKTGEVNCAQNNLSPCATVDVALSTLAAYKAYAEELVVTEKRLAEEAQVASKQKEEQQIQDYYTRLFNQVCDYKNKIKIAQSRIDFQEKMKRQYGVFQENELYEWHRNKQSVEAAFQGSSLQYTQETGKKFNSKDCPEYQSSDDVLTMKMFTSPAMDEVTFQKRLCSFSNNERLFIRQVEEQRRMIKQAGVFDKSAMYDAGSSLLVTRDAMKTLKEIFTSRFKKNFNPKSCN